MDRDLAVSSTREALAILTARVSDAEGYTSRLSERVFAEGLDAERAVETWQRAAGQLIGMLNLASRLVVELSVAPGQSRTACLERLGEWVSGIEAGHHQLG